MSESTPNPSTTNDLSASATAEEATSVAAAPETTLDPNQAQGAPAPAGKRKRKRKRKRKSANAVEGADTVAADSSVPQGTASVTHGPVSPGQAAQQRHAHPRGARGTREHDTHQQGASRSGKKKPPFEARRHSFKDAGERSSGRHEFLASWRWQPTGELLSIFARATDELLPDPAPATPEPNTQTDQEVVPGELVVAGDAGGAEQHQPPEDGAAPEPTVDPNEALGLPKTDTVAAPPAAKKPGLFIPSGAEFTPWLSASLERCDPAVRSSLLVSLCSHRAFRQQCANSAVEFKAMVERAAALYDALFLDSPPTVAPTAGTPGEPQHDARDTLREGLAAVCEGPLTLVRIWPLAARERLFELASDFELQHPLYAGGAQLFHDNPKQLGRVNLARVCDALAQGDDTAAKEYIAELKVKPGAPGLLPLLSEAMDGQRFGNLVVLSYGGASSRGADPRAPKRHSGFCLESQRDVWIRSGETHESPAFEHYSQLHRRAQIPSVVGLYTFGVTRSRKPYLSVLRKGISLQRRIETSWGLSRELAVRFATDLTLLASALCRAGVRLPDLDARRFELDDAQRLWLSDLWGAELIEPRAQDPEAVSVCRDSVAFLLSSQPGFVLPTDWREVITHSADFETLVATLRTLEKSRRWGS